MPSKLEEVRAAVIKVVPELKELVEKQPVLEPIIRLSDILIAIEKNNAQPNHLVDIVGHFFKVNIQLPMPIENTNVYWNLSQDDLSLQSDETINFLHSLLV